ncbi:hypothetical protein JCM15765_02680 [Paradesulfitobacterium aromaticivorans]
MRTQIRIGNVLVEDGLTDFDCWRSRLDPVDILEFSFRPGAALSISNDAKTELWLTDPDGTLFKVFTGQIDRTSTPLRARDDAVILLDTPVYQTFLDATPQEVVAFGLRQAGIVSAQLTNWDFPRKDFIVAAPDVFNLIKQVNKYWSIAFLPYFDANETFHWHERSEQFTAPLFAYGKNIISLEFDGQRGSVLTIGIPSITHSTIIALEHPDVPHDEVLVDAVHHFMTETGGLRTELFFSLVV